MGSENASIIVLSGGKGTRSESPSLPKILQTLTDDLMVLDTINQSINDVAYSEIVFALGDVIENQQEEIFRRTWRHKPRFVVSKAGGTSLAVKSAAKMCTADYLVIIMGDSALSFPVDHFLQKFKTSGKQAGFVSRFSEHSIDSDGFSRTMGDIGYRFMRKEVTETSSADRPVYSVSGIVFAKAGLIEKLSGKEDLIHELVDTLEENREAPILMTSRFYSRDTGTKERIQKARIAFASGSAQRRGRMGVGAIFLDRDGTLIPNEGDARTSISKGEIPKTLARAISAANNAGVPIFVVSNQPGIAKGKISFEDVERVFSQMQFQLGEYEGFFDDFRYCPHHPEQGHDGEMTSLKISCSCRKPSPGMFLELAREHRISLQKSWLIGDSDADKIAASRCGMAFAGVSENALEMTAERIQGVLRGLAK